MTTTLSRLCPNCSAPLRQGTALCSTCGHRSRDDVQLTAGQGGLDPERELPPGPATSTLLYICADRIVPKATARHRLGPLISWAATLSMLAFFVALEARGGFAPPEWVVLLVFAAFVVLACGERVFPKATAHLSGARAELPCSSRAVLKRPLAATLLAAAFWSLREQGLIALELSASAFRLPGRNSFQVRVTRRGQARLGGLEGAIMHHLSTNLSDSVTDIVRRWLGTPGPDPWKQVVEVAADDVRRHRFHCAQMAQLDETGNDVIMHWQDFRTREIPLSTALLDACIRALGSNKEIAPDVD